MSVAKQGLRGVPGGAVEVGESPYAAVVREVREELGLAVRPGRLPVTDWVPPRPGRTEGLMLVFDGGTLTAEQTTRIELPAEELRGWARCTEREAGDQGRDLRVLVDHSCSEHNGSV